MLDPERVGEVPRFTERWGGSGSVGDIDGPVHWVEYGDTDNGSPPVVMVHGLGGSHLNWVRVAPLLAKHTRVLTVDLPGFGLSEVGRRQAGIDANAIVLQRFLQDVVGTPVILMGNSMGGMISSFAAAAHPESISGLVLVNPALPVGQRLPDPQVALQFALQFIPFVGEGYLRFASRNLTDRQLVERMVEMCFADPSRASQEVLEVATAFTGYRRGLPSQDAAFLQASRSLLLTLARPGRYQDAMRSIQRPVLLIHGDKDKLVPVASARKAAAANERWDSVILNGVGHTPQLEVPDTMLDHVMTWVGKHGLIDV
ncbi:alpha/beta hydrolase [Rhodococcus sp. NPDC049939]|uniref:alpha/beta fold hydrolase n=1 Tax=Rhodococcus sp. NPDC049939 TaxID=3155511 RepID=UPI0033F7029F